MKKEFRVIIIVFGLTVVAFAAWASTRDGIKSNPKEINSTITSETSITAPEPTTFIADPNHKITHSGWIPNWASYDGESTLKSTQNYFDDISPVWYEVNPDGTLIDKRPGNFTSLMEHANENDILMIPSIAMFDFELIAKVLRNDKNLNRHVESIVSAVVDHDYDGIDLDYESTELKDKEKYFEFLEKLSAELHTQDKLLTVTVLAKWGDSVAYPSLIETRAVQDWERIAPLADEIRIMAYDYTFIKARYPGPIAPIDWVKIIMDYAVTKVPRDKLVLGIHLYSYEWFVNVESNDDKFKSPAIAFQPDYTGNENYDEGDARSYTYDTVSEVLRKYDGESMDFQGEKIYRYRKINDDTGQLEDRVLVYIDSTGVELREQLAKDYNIKGVVFWRLGREGDLIKQ